jgi:hypothetical protein
MSTANTAHNPWDALRELFARLFGRANTLEQLPLEQLQAKIVVIDHERERVLKRVAEVEHQREELRFQARRQNERTKREYARRIIERDEEIHDFDDKLDQFYQLRRILRQLIRLREKTEQMKQLGLDRVLGRRLNLAELRRAIDETVVDGVVNSEKLAQVSGMLDDALTYTRAQVKDDRVKEVLDQILEDEAVESGLTDVGPRRSVSTDIQRVLNEIDQDSPSSYRENN